MRFKNDKKWEKECLGTCPEGGRGRPGGAKSVSSTTHWSKNPSEVPATMTDGSLSLHAKEIMGPQMFADEKTPTGSARKRGEAGSRYALDVGATVQEAIVEHVLL